MEKNKTEIENLKNQIIAEFNKVSEKLMESINQNIDDIEKAFDQIQIITSRVNENSILIKNLTELIKSNRSLVETTGSDMNYKEIDERLKKVETKYLKMEEDNELEPDIPAVLDVIDSKLQEWRNLDDVKKVRVPMIAYDLEIIYDVLSDLLKYTLIKGYSVDLLDQQVAKLTSYDELLKEAKEKNKDLDIRSRSSYV